MFILVPSNIKNCPKKPVKRLLMPIKTAEVTPLYAKRNNRDYYFSMTNCHRRKKIVRNNSG